MQAGEDLCDQQARVDELSCLDMAVEVAEGKS